MSVTYRIDKGNRTVYVEAVGEIAAEDLMNNEKEIISDPDLEEGYDTFADFSKAIPSHTIDLEKIELCKKYIESIQGHRGRCKWAIYAPDDQPHSFALMFAILSDDLIIETEVFREKNKALEWLNAT